MVDTRGAVPNKELLSCTVHPKVGCHSICKADDLIVHNAWDQELMSGGAAKERASTAYAQVPSKSKLLASELPNIIMETCSSI